MGKGKESITDVPCGNTIGILGIDSYLTKTGTITDHPSAHCIRNLKYCVSPIVKVAVEPKNMGDLPKLLEGLKKLAKSDPIVQCSLNESGQNVIAASGELHIETCVYDLLHKYTHNLEVKISEPTVTYKETVVNSSLYDCMVKTPNHHNRLYLRAEPLTDLLSEAIEKSEITVNDDIKVRSKKLVEEFQWEKDSTMKIWCFGPENQGANILVDLIKGIQYMNEIKDSMNIAFQHATKEGVLAEEELRGVRFNILDAKLHPDSIHRGPGQIIPAARRLYNGAQYTAEPRLLEPIFLCEITTNLEGLKGVRQCLNKRRGVFLDEIQIQGTPLYLVKAHLPAAESFGFNSLLRSLTGGVAFPQMIFSHWSVIQVDPFDPKGKAFSLVKDIRGRKGLKNLDLPKIEDILDKL
jgi:elongation factor 2